MIKRATQHLFLVLLLSSEGCAYSVFAEGDQLQYSLPESEGWALAYKDYAPAPPGSTGGVWIEEYVRPGQSVEDWSELVTVVRTYRELFDSKKGHYKDLVDLREKNCPGSTRWNVVEESDERLLYEWWSKPCMGFASQYEIAVLIDGRRDRFHFRYTNMNPESDEAKRDQWIQILRAANVTIGPN